MHPRRLLDEGVVGPNGNAPKEVVNDCFKSVNGWANKGPARGFWVKRDCELHVHRSIVYIYEFYCSSTSDFRRPQRSPSMLPVLMASKETLGMQQPGSLRCVL